MDRSRRITDVGVVVLALVSVALLGLTAFGSLDDGQQLTVFWVDVGVCVLFLAEFVGSWRRSGWRPGFWLRNWYEVLGMIPVAHPVFLERGWTIALWVVVVLARVGRAADRLVGERVTAAITTRATHAVVETVKHPITVAVLDEVALVLQTGAYTQNLANALEENRGELKAMVLEKLEADPLAGRISLLPFHHRVVDTVTETTLRVIFEVLSDPRTDELISDVLRENIEQMREEVRKREYGSGRGAATWTPPGRAGEFSG
ncbi:MAG: ion transporter [Nocardioidaceae bacterium]